MNIDFRKYTIDELLDAARNIDKNTYPDRYALLQAELENRKPEIEKLEAAQYEQHKSATISRLSALAWFQIAGGIVMLTMLMFTSNMATIDIISNLFFILLALTSGFLLLNDHSIGYGLSLFNQGLQVISLVTAGAILNYSSLGGVYVFLSSGFVVGFTAQFNPGFQFYLGEVQTSGRVGVDLLAIFFIYVLISGQKIKLKEGK